jgi:hypothetical protein
MSTNVVTIDDQTIGASGILGLNQNNSMVLGAGRVIPEGKYRKVDISLTGGAANPTLGIATETPL